MKLRAAAQAIGAHATGPDVEFTRVETDTRGLTPGCLFVALRGMHFDGHAFAAQALQQGAAAVMVAAGSGLDLVPALVVDDTRLALGRLAAWHRACMPARLAAITGSNGKTTVKEMLAAICQAEAGEAAVLATRGNLNNDIGVPLTLLGLTPAHRYAVIEMGMNHPGELDYLTHLARPDVALVNNALRAHLEGLGSVRAVARAKGEIYAGLRDGGVAILNADDPHAGLWREMNLGRRMLCFGHEAHAQVRIVDEGQDPHARVVHLLTPAGPITAMLQVPGAHNRRNAAAAAAAALALDIPADAIARGLAAYAGTRGRLQYHACPGGGQLIDDSYNANPDSVLAAIGVLAGQPGHRILVLGDMGELGPDAAALHREVGEKARAAGIQTLLCLGDLSRNTAQGFGAGALHCTDMQTLLATLRPALGASTSVLVKGSRAMRMERVVQSLLKDEPCS
ncbi:MAG TPA: UDP-N-acetylmuramoyl-tripeptide--D-alanyl-D-alanine ligase [Thiobacillaceae bacterium]|nr:UDP-N-acetylmuramoyl-tripeptide--D-alanyl-D-alanine ligase [Thiobacillaceae bacterium]HNU63710.1 UDP-N-acetylmuramoyl-tripeptide--D-alanyl-D-alanine ligase [Thiobacillaceae bacterium]